MRPSFVVFTGAGNALKATDNAAVAQDFAKRAGGAAYRVIGFEPGIVRLELWWDFTDDHRFQEGKVV